MSWLPVGNLKGADGTATIPDPLVVNNQLKIGTDLRITKVTGGGKVEVRNPTSGVWLVATEWNAIPPAP
jgi:predicted acyltransferase (DUF342 family)